MTSDAVDTYSPALLAVVQTLLSVQGLDDVRAAATHGAQVITRCSTLSVYESQRGGYLELTRRSGDELGPSALAVEDLLADKARRSGSTVSTLDMPSTEAERLTVHDYTQRNCLCLARPLYAYGELTGVLALHYTDRVALEQAEFDTLRRFAQFAAVALLIARTRAELHNFAYSDALTGLANRRWLEVEFARLQGSEVSVLLIDFDGLKMVNDTLGFDRGDALIQAVGVRLAASARANEFVVRYGGDEFVLVMPGTGRDGAVRRAEELTKTLDRITLPDDLAPLFHGASVGPATASTGEDLWEVLRRASTEMRSRKRRRKSDRGTAGYDVDPPDEFPRETGTRDRPRYD